MEPWIKMRRCLREDPRVVRIMSACDADRLQTLGALFSAWCLADEQTIDGTLDGYTTTVFDQFVGLDGLSQAMESVGWLEIGDGFLKITGFEHHNGKSAKRRAKESVRKKSARNADKSKTSCATEKEKEKESNTSPPPILTIKDSFLRARDERAEGFEGDWDRWLDYHLAIHGSELNPIAAETLLMELLRRGPDKAARDIEFSILKNAKSVLDSDNDFDKQRNAPRKHAPSKAEIGF